jgi:hypothetical protein
MKVWKKQNAVTAADAAPPAEEAPAAEVATAEAPAPDAPAAEAAPEAPVTPEHVDVGEPQIDQETYDAAIAEGLPDRVARSKAKSAWVKKARKGLA